MPFVMWDLHSRRDLYTAMPEQIGFSADVLICSRTPAVCHTDTLPTEIPQIKENVYDISCAARTGKPLECRPACVWRTKKSFYPRLKRTKRITRRF